MFVRHGLRIGHKRVWPWPMQIELLDRRNWTTRAELATAIFEYIEAFYNPLRRHSALDYCSPIDYERFHTTTNTAA